MKKILGFCFFLSSFVFLVYFGQAKASSISIFPPRATKWVAYTPTISGFGTVSNVKFMSRRMAENLEIQGTFQAGTTAASAAQITIGYNGADQNVTLGDPINNVTTNFIMGAWAGVATLGVIRPGNPGIGKFLLMGISTSPTTNMNGNVVGNNTQVSIQATVPILGWSVN